MTKHPSLRQALARGIRVIDKKRLPSKHYSLIENDSKWHLFYKGELLAKYYNGIAVVQGAYEHDKRTTNHKPAT